MHSEQMFDTYFGLCAEYYILDKPNPPEDALQFYLQYIKETTTPILEPMCGTGRFLIPLMQLGYNIEGFDASSFMLEHLHNKCGSLNIRPKVWHGYVLDIPHQNKYGFVFIPSGSIGLITNLDELKKSLNVIFDALIDGGTFVFEAETLHAASTQVGVWKGSIHKRKDDKKIILSTLDLPLKNNIATTMCRYELVDIANIIKTEIEEFNVRLHDPEELRRLLIEVGFQSVKIMKAFDRNKKPDSTDDVVIFECRK